MTDEQSSSAATPPKATRRIDPLGWSAFAVYIVIAAVFVFGFGRSLRTAVETQNETPCRSQAPRHALVQGSVLTLEGKPIPNAELVTIEGGRSRPATKVAEDGSFSIFMPKGGQSIIARAPGREGVEAPLQIGQSEILGMEFKLDKAGNSGGTFAEQSREPFVAPDFTVTDLEGNEVKLSDYRGKLVLVNFWATWCEPCITEWPQVSMLSERIGDREDVAVLAVSIDKEREAISPFLERMAMGDTRTTVLWDSSTTLHTQFGSTNIPDTYFIDEQGLVMSVFVNVREWGMPEAIRCVESSIDR
ncbi:MAG: redoxin domain-containing protein [Deltaproteobacteria bacterium]|nr:redoxin domain-containing protein [Deltaproteobacteria bacterium]